ncbi:hypothetical protein QFC21_004856 [Naganishia friedmannii]|uniref:Uncharacterized protein n=1 Tax=Naganishia friedmannii TaxID=89922 RepID=A0ACC2VF46_9TREE|nr:hypothetical protein QFC21_004856 [Naganishia friedmannii]
MEFIRRQLHKLDKSSLERLDNPKRRYRHVNGINILHHIFVENLTNVLNWLTMVVAAATLLALSFQSLSFHGGDGKDGKSWYDIDLRKGTGVDLTTVGGLTIRSWGWVDARGEVHRQLPFILFPYQGSFFYAALRFSTCIAFAIALMMMIAIIFMMCRAVQNTDQVEDLIIPAQCTALCAACLAGAQFVFLLGGSMGLRPTLHMESLGEITDQVLNAKQQDTIKFGAGLIVGWSSLGGCAIWLLIAYGRYNKWVAYMKRPRDKYKRTKQRLQKVLPRTREERRRKDLEQPSAEEVSFGENLRDKGYE